MPHSLKDRKEAGMALMLFSTARPCVTSEPQPIIHQGNKLPRKHSAAREASLIHPRFTKCDTGITCTIAGKPF